MSLIKDQKDKNDPRSIPTMAELGQLTEQVKSAPVHSSASQALLNTSDATIPPEQTPEEQPVLSEGDIPLEENQGQLESVSSQYPEIDFEALQQQSTFPGIPDVGETSPLLPDTSIIKPESLLTGDRFPTFHELDQYEHHLRGSYSLPKYNPVQDGFNADLGNWATRMLRSLQEPPQQTDYSKPSLNSERKGFWESYLSYWGSIFYDEGESKTIQLVNPLTTPLTETRFGEFGKGLLGGANYLLNFLGNTIAGGATDVYNLVTGNRNPESNEPNFIQAIKGRDYSFTLDRSAARPLSVSDPTEKRPETINDLTNRSWIYWNPIIQVPMRAIGAITGSDQIPNPFDLFLNKKDADVWLDRSLSFFEFSSGLALDSIAGLPQDGLMTFLAKGGKNADEVLEATQNVLGKVDENVINVQPKPEQLQLPAPKPLAGADEAFSFRPGYASPIRPSVIPNIKVNALDRVEFTPGNIDDSLDLLYTQTPQQFDASPRRGLIDDSTFSKDTIPLEPDPEIVDADIIPSSIISTDFYPVQELFNKGGLLQLPQTAPTTAPRLLLPPANTYTEPTSIIQQTISESIRGTDSLTPKPMLALPPAKDIPTEVFNNNTPVNIIKSLDLTNPNPVLEISPLTTDIVRRTNVELTDLAVATGDITPRIVPLSDTEINILKNTFGEKYNRYGMSLNPYIFRAPESVGFSKQDIIDSVWSKLVNPDFIESTVPIMKASLPEALQISDDITTSKLIQTKVILDDLGKELSDMKRVVSESEQALAKNLDYLDNAVDAGRKNIFTNSPAPTVDPLTPVIPRNPKLAQFINKQQFYHGSKAEIDLTVINPLEGAARSELGVGIHLTHDPKIAQHYADAMTARNVPPVESRIYSDLGRVYDTILSVQSPLSATKSLEPDALIAINNTIETLKLDPTIPKPLIDTLKRTANNKKTTYQQFLNKLDEAFNKYLGDIQEDKLLSAQRNISAELRKQGYDSVFFQTKYGKVKPEGVKDDYVQVMLLGNTPNNSFRGVLPPKLRSKGDILSNATGRYNADSIAEQVFKNSMFAKANKEDSAVFLQTQMINKMKDDTKKVSDQVENLAEAHIDIERNVKKIKKAEQIEADRAKMQAYQKQNEDITKHYNTPEEGLC